MHTLQEDPSGKQSRANKSIALPLCPQLQIAELNSIYSTWHIDTEYNKRLDRQRPCLEDDLTAGSNNIARSNKSV